MHIKQSHLLNMHHFTVYNDTLKTEGFKRLLLSLGVKRLRKGICMLNVLFSGYFHLKYKAQIQCSKVK